MGNAADQKPITDEARAAVENLLDVDLSSQEVPASQDEATIHERMIAIVGELPAIGKTDYNKQQNFHFRSHDSVLNALNPLLAKHGVFVIPDILERVTDQRTTGQGKAMYEVNLHVRFTFYGAAGDEISGSTWGEGTDMGDKATNKAMTMAFKAILAQAFSVSTGENVDTDAMTPEETVGRASVGGSRQQGGETSQEATGARVTLPTSWAEWKQRMVALGVPERDQAAWLEDATGDGNEKWAKARKLLVLLTARDGVDFQTEPRRIMQECILEAFEGLAVAGPPWQIIATEEHLPTYEQYQADLEAANVAQTASDTGEPVDDLDIPFGDDDYSSA